MHEHSKLETAVGRMLVARIVFELKYLFDLDVKYGMASILRDNINNYYFSLQNLIAYIHAYLSTRPVYK
jgi:hypothetical protein